MGEIITGFHEAISMLFSFDKEVYDIILLSLFVSISSTVISTAIGVPLGILIGLYKFKFKNGLIRLIYTMMSLPPVIAGLVVFLFIMRKGPLGFLGLSFTPQAMIIAQTCLVTPIIIGLTYNGVKERAVRVKEVARTLGAKKHETLILLIHEMRIGIMAAVVTGLGRAVSEVGAVMLVGGNIKYHTRVMTTYIAMMQNMGEYSRAIAIGIVLLMISFLINSMLYNFQQMNE